MFQRGIKISFIKLMNNEQKLELVSDLLSRLVEDMKTSIPERAIELFEKTLQLEKIQLKLFHNQQISNEEMLTIATVKHFLISSEGTAEMLFTCKTMEYVSVDNRITET